LNGRVSAEHANSRAELRSTKRNHVLANVASNKLAMLRVGMGKDVLNQVISILITSNIDQGDSRTIQTTLANTIKVATQEISTANFEALLNDLGGELVHAILGCVTNDMINCSTSVRRGTMLTDMLDAPVAKLAMCNDVDTSKNLFDARALWYLVSWCQNSRLGK
jgi:hypothetical protein